MLKGEHSSKSLTKIKSVFMNTCYKYFFLYLYAFTERYFILHGLLLKIDTQHCLNFKHDRSEIILPDMSGNSTPLYSLDKQEIAEFLLLKPDKISEFTSVKMLLMKGEEIKRYSKIKGLASPNPNPLSPV